MLAPADVSHEAASSEVERSAIVEEENVAIFSFEFPAMLFPNFQYSTVQWRHLRRLKFIIRGVYSRWSYSKVKICRDHDTVTNAGKEVSKSARQVGDTDLRFR